MKTLLPALSLFAAALASPGVVPAQIIQVNKPTTIDLGKKKSAPKQRQPKPRPGPASTSAPKTPPPTAAAPAEKAQTVLKKAEKGAPRVEPKPLTLSTSGMQKPDLLRDIHDGRFTRLDNNSPFRTAFEAYVTSFSGRCQSYLSPNRVEITEFVNTYRTRTTFIPWGRVLVPLTSERIVGTREVGTGIYAEPEFGEMYVKLGNEQLRSMAGNFRLSDLQATARDMMAWVPAVVEQQVQIYADVNALLAYNRCDGPSTRRFAENLLRFAKGQPSVQSANGEKSYFAKACEAKLPRLFPKSPPGACGCIDREFTAALHGWQIAMLEEEFDAQDFGLFMMYSVSKIGLQQKIADCVGARLALK